MRTFFRSAGSAGGDSGVVPAAGSRSASLIAAVALVGGQGLVLIIAGLAIAVAGILGEPSDVTDAELMGAIVFLSGIGLFAVARGLRAGRRWARSPALVWQMILLCIGGTQAGAEPTLAVPLLVVGLLTVVALFHPATNAALED